MRRLFVIVTVAVLAACSVVKVPVATGGSKSDGTVVMSYEYGGFEQPKPDWNSAQQEATQRCQAWGYTGAEAFGGVNKKCNGYNAYGCVRYTVHRTYQCT